MNDFEKLVIDKLNKIEDKQDDFNGRLVSVETKIKLMIPFFTMVFSTGWAFLKAKVFGMKG